MVLIGKKKGLTWGCKEISIEKNLQRLYDQYHNKEKKKKESENRKGEKE